MYLCVWIYTNIYIYIWDNCICKPKQGGGRWSSLNNPRDLCVLFWDLRCCCELGLCTSSQDLLWSMSWEWSYSQHDITCAGLLWSPDHLLWHLKQSVPSCCPLQVTQTGLGGCCLVFKTKQRCSAWGAGPLLPAPRLSLQKFIRVKEIVYWIKAWD